MNRIDYEILNGLRNKIVTSESFLTLVLGMAAQRRQFPIDFFSTFVSFDAVQCALENEMAVFSGIFYPKQAISFFQKMA